MAIKQLPFEKGENFGIRQKGHRIPSEAVMENIKDNLVNDTLIVKCGKSFWDVSAYPEIFASGDEFRVEDLTSIDRKQMNKPEPPKPAFVEALVGDSKKNPMSMLFHKTDVQEPEPVQYVRKTHYFEPRQIEALTLLCHKTRLEVSAMMRAITDAGIEVLAEKLGYGDILAEADENLANIGHVGKKKSLNE